MNVEKLQQDVKKLVKTGVRLEIALLVEIHPEKVKEVREHLNLKDKVEFSRGYQSWYSEALVTLMQLLPSRVEDFIDYYKPRRARKEVNYENYTVSDYLQRLQVRRLGEVVVGLDAAFGKFQQQVRIVESLVNRFDSSLYDLKTVLQADLFDNEIDAAGELLKRGFVRAAGALAGVVLESHLKVVVQRHDLKPSKKNPTIADYNDALKSADVISVAHWRKVQYLADVRNACSHSKDVEPKGEDVKELLEGVRALTKNLF
ncbi:hypothetical protein [Saccharothrix sp.]|uniref:hypothetical protein n=1 Tax=Saccharothrix sp. TaxID=1873460 RepID=UPI0028115129|nr:hypothetical protein [Saccharothrix sp.]